MLHPQPLDQRLDRQRHDGCRTGGRETQELRFTDYAGESDGIAPRQQDEAVIHAEQHQKPGKNGPHIEPEAGNRLEALLAYKLSSQAENRVGRQKHRPFHDHHRDFQQSIDQPQNRPNFHRSCLLRGKPEQDRKDDDGQHVLIEQGPLWIDGQDIGDQLRRRATDGAFAGNRCEPPIDDGLDAVFAPHRKAGFKTVGQHHPETGRKNRRYQNENQHLEADGSKLADIARARHPLHDRAEHERHQNDRYQPKKNLSRQSQPGADRGSPSRVDQSHIGTEQRTDADAADKPGDNL